MVLQLRIGVDLQDLEEREEGVQEAHGRRVSASRLRSVVFLLEGWGYRDYLDVALCDVVGASVVESLLGVDQVADVCHGGP